LAVACGIISPVHLTTAQAAEYLGVIPRRVRALIESGQLPAERFGQAYMIKLADLKKLKRRPSGRPRKARP
jgi:excisionase family DNA binding protein